jgi:hypothetical protein
MTRKSPCKTKNTISTGLKRRQLETVRRQFRAIQ